MRDSQWSWWGEDNVDEVMMNAGDMGSGQLGHVPPIELLCHDEVKLKAVT